MLEKYPDDSGINNDLGYLYADQGKNLEQAERMVRKALEDDSTNSAFLDSLGWVLFKRGKTDESIKYLEQAAVNYPIPDGDPTILDHLGEVYFLKKDYGKARDAWKRAEASSLRQEPPDKRLPEIRKKFKLLEKAEATTGDGQARKP